MMKKYSHIFYLPLLVVLVMLLTPACSSDSENKHIKENIKPNPNALFQQVASDQSGIDFVNEVKHNERFNIFSYRNFYNGAGVSIGDVNKDGLSDIYFTNNTGKNKLYLNKGNFEFEDITETAGVGGTRGWSTGVVMVDINNDGWLDIYVCNAGYVEGDDQQNELFINTTGEGDGKTIGFKEAAADYQLDEKGYTTHAAFFDYDMDGDLDCYILNNSFMPVNTLNYSNKRELYAEDWPVKDFLKGGGDKLLRNDKGTFNDVSKEAGIYGSLIGFGLGVTVGDVNNDQLLDMYVSNDFFERDYLYINQGDGTFSEEIKDWMGHISLASMGADMADINNDGYPEIFVTEMLPSSDYRRKTTTLFENYTIYLTKLKRDFYHQYMHNTLQLNNKNESFSEIAWYSGVSASDWSWGALLFDADNDGYRDIYVCNGIYRDVTDQDFMNFFADEVIQKMALTGKKEDMDNVIEKMPSNPQINKFFHNQQNLSFNDSGIDFGFGSPSFSNGAAYGDLDNDGDLDLIVNNLNQEAFVYRNRSNEKLDNHYLKVVLEGTPQNTYAVGSKVTVYTDGESNNFQLIPTRGFQSSVDYRMVFGLGKKEQVDSVVVIWHDQQRSVLLNPVIDTTLAIAYKDIEKTRLGQSKNTKSAAKTDFFTAVNNPFKLHKEDGFIDFFQEGLTMRMLSQEGPQAVVGDVNGDGREDVFIGAATGHFGQLYLQSAGGFEEANSKDFERYGDFEDTALSLFDADGDGDLDLFAGSGGNHRPMGARLLQDRLYLNDGKGNFTLYPKAFPKNGFNTSVAVPLDFDQDGDLDLYVGSRSVPQRYGISPLGFLYENDGKANFKDVTQAKAAALGTLGMITDAQLINVVGDEKEELVIVGEWMSPHIFSVENGQITPVESNLTDYKGWWYVAKGADVDNDGDMDVVLGNRGENFYFTGTKEAPAKLWLGDFDENGTIEKIMTQTLDGRDMPIPMKKELTEQIVSLKKQNLKNAEYAEKSIQDLFTKAVLEKGERKEPNYFQSAVALNDGNGQFTLTALPAEVQFSCVCDIYCTDLNGDNKTDLILGGNDAGFTPQFSKLDASFGHVLMNEGGGNFTKIDQQANGFFVKGDVKQILPVQVGKQTHILTLINRDYPKLFKMK